MPRVEKAQFRNNTQGYIGVVVIGPRGDETGIPVAPGDTVWLSEDEQQLTANAPRDPADNPFVAQTHIVEDNETGARNEVQITPLTLVSEDRYVPSNLRPIGADITGEGALVAQPASETTPASAPAPEAPPASEAPPAPVEEPTPAPAPPVPPAAAAAAAAASEAPSPLPAPPAPAVPTPPGADAARTAPADEGRVADETAAVSPGPGSEETGAALSPSGTAPRGEYLAGEEVGTPDAPADPAGQSPPAPLPPSEG